jgi:hypothetical protein
MAVVQPANQRLTLCYRGKPPTLFAVVLAACGCRLPDTTVHTICQ